MNFWHARLAAAALRHGGLVLHATEAVWGFACDPFDARAVAFLLDSKRRPAAKGLIVIGADSACFEPELAALPATERCAVLKSWPGPVTWVLPNQRFPSWVTGCRDTVAVRVPGHPQSRALCRAFGGPLVSTSANRSGRPPARCRLSARGLLRDLGRSPRGRSRLPPVYLLPGETLGRRNPSDIRTPAGTMLRGR